MTQAQTKFSAFITTFKNCFNLSFFFFFSFTDNKSREASAEVFTTTVSDGKHKVENKITWVVFEAHL